MVLPFNCPHVCNDRYYTRQSEELLNNWFELVKQVAEDRRLSFVFIPSSFKAVNYFLDKT